MLSRQEDSGELQDDVSEVCGGEGEAEEKDTEGESEKLRQKTSVKST